MTHDENDSNLGPDVSDSICRQCAGVTRQSHIRLYHGLPKQQGQKSACGTTDAPIPSHSADVEIPLLVHFSADNTSPPAVQWSWPTTAWSFLSDVSEANAHVTEIRRPRTERGGVSANCSFASFAAMRRHGVRADSGRYAHHTLSSGAGKDTYIWWNGSTLKINIIHQINQKVGSTAETSLGQRGMSRSITSQSHLTINMP